jgi:hypothetical protein
MRFIEFLPCVDAYFLANPDKILWHLETAVHRGLNSIKVSVSAENKPGQSNLPVLPHNLFSDASPSQAKSGGGGFGGVFF